MREKFKALEALQAVDRQILDLKKAAEAHPKRLAAIEAQLSLARSAVDAERARQDDNQRRRDDLERALNAEKEKVKKWEARLAEMRTTREYAALAREVDISKKSNLNMQEDMLALMQEAEAIDAALIARRDEYKTKEASFAGEVSELKARTGEFQATMKGLEAKRAEVAKACDKALVRKYDAIRAKRGVALVAVVRGTCQGCHIAVPPQLYNTVITGHTVETCPNCNRLIYVPDAPHETTKV